MLPILLAPAPLLLAALQAPDAVPKLSSILPLVVFALDVALLTGLCLQLKWWVVLGAALWMELMLLVWLMRNLDLLRRWRRFDRFVRRREAQAAQIYDRRHWIRRFHFWGVVGMTFLPLNTGIFTGVFIGKVTGLSDRTTVGAVFLGTTLWASFLTAVFALSVRTALDALSKVLPELQRVC